MYIMVCQTDPSPVDGLLQQLHHVFSLHAGTLEAFGPADQDALRAKTHVKHSDTQTVSAILFLLLP